MMTTLRRIAIRSVGARALGFAVAVFAIPTAVNAQVAYTWNGTTDGNFSTPSNWDPNGVAVVNGTSNSRLNVNNTNAARPLTYTATQGTTIYTGGAVRALVIASGGSGNMVITGGTFDSRQSTEDLMVNGQFVGSLTMNGGNYINTLGGSNIFALGFNGGALTGAQATLNMQSGGFTTGILQFGQSAGMNPGGLVSVANLDGGILTTNQIRESATAGTPVALVNSTINFNGGTLRAGQTNVNFLSNGSVDNAVVQGNGAIIDTNTFDVTIGKALTAGTGGGGLTKNGNGTLSLTGVNTYTGATLVSAGTLLVNGSLLSTSSLTVSAGATLGGSGRIATTIAGAGLVSPGNSPGITTANAVNPTGGTSYAFEFTALGSPDYGTAAASINDVLRLTAATPFTASLVAANVIDVYFDVAALGGGDTFRGGFYTDVGSDFLPSIASASYSYWVRGDNSGSDRVFNGQSYYTLANFGEGLSVTVSTVSESANFGAGPVNGQVSQFVIVPEPGTLGLIALAAAGASGGVRKRFRQPVARCRPA